MKTRASKFSEKANGGHPVQKPIETKRTILRSFTLEDAKDVFEYASEPEVTKYLTNENEIRIYTKELLINKDKIIQL